MKKEIYNKIKLSDIVEVNPKFDNKNIGSQVEVSFIPMQLVSEEGKIIDYQIKSLHEVKKGYTPFIENDILFAKITPCMENGKRAIAKNLKNGIGFGSTEFHVLRPKKEIHPKYLYYFISQTQFRKQAEKNMTGSAGQKRVPVSFLKSVSLWLPSFETQEKTIEILDKMQGLIDKRKAQIEALDQLTQSVFLKMFGDPIVNLNNFNTLPLKDLCLSIYGGGTPSKSKPEFYTGNIPWVTPKDMKTILIEDSIDHITNDAVNNSSAKIIPSNSLLMVIRSGILKKKLPLAINTREVTVNQDMKAFIFDRAQVTTEYMLYFFIFYQRVMLSQVRSVTADNLDFQQIKEILVPIPNIEEQQKFTNIFYKVIEEKDKYLYQLTELENNFNSIMQRAFKGELFNEENKVSIV